MKRKFEDNGDGRVKITDTIPTLDEGFTIHVRYISATQQLEDLTKERDSLLTQINTINSRLDELDALIISVTEVKQLADSIQADKIESTINSLQETK